MVKEFEETEKKEETIKICPECHAYYKGVHTSTDCNYNKGVKDSGSEKVDKVVGTGGASPTRNEECNIPTLPIESDDSKLPELQKVCTKCGYSGNVRDIVCPECHNSLFKHEYEKPPEPTNEEIIFDAGPPCETCKHNSGIDESYCNPCVRGTNYEPKLRENEPTLKKALEFIIADNTYTPWIIDLLKKAINEPITKSKDTTYILVQCPQCKHKYLINKEDLS